MLAPLPRDPETHVGVSIDPGFSGWMQRFVGSLAISTYQAGKLLLIGHDGRQVTLLMRDFDKPMGMAVHGPNLALATRHDLMVLANAPLLAGDFLIAHPGKYDALYCPRVSYHCGDLAMHDVAFDERGQLWVINTRFSCLCLLSERHSFEPQWKPPFLSDLVPEDRCHLNGLAIVDGAPRFVTCLGETDTVGGWRENKATGGCVVDVASNQLIVRGLAMPHSPRWHDGRLYVLNSGAGELLRINPGNGASEVVCVLPSYLRGLDFVGPYAVVGMSKIREKHIFGGLPVQQRFKELLCGIAVVDLRFGRVVGMMQFTSGCSELFEVRVLSGVRQPMVLNLEKEAARQAFTAPDFSYWLRPENEIKDSGATP